MTMMNTRYGYALVRKSTGAVMAISTSFDALITYIQQFPELGSPYVEDEDGGHSWVEGHDIVIQSPVWVGPGTIDG